jgi:nucleoside-diphosphate-sugar epimerase
MRQRKVSHKPSDSGKAYFITGVAGFIGFFLAKKLLEQGCRVIGINNSRGLALVKSLLSAYSLDKT